MAQDLSVLFPKLLALGLVSLRQQAIMPRIVNRGYETLAGEKGSTITIPISSAVAAQDVVPAATPQASVESVPTSVTLNLDTWKEAPFFLTDKDMLEVDNGVIPMQASEAIKSLANAADNSILALYKKIYGYVGTAGTTPLATDLTDYLQARKTLNNQLAPVDPRYMVMNGDTEANALNLRAFQDASFTGNLDGIIAGQINNKVGARWLMDQNMGSHTAGTITTGLIAKASTAQAVGLKAIVCHTAASTGACALLEGDIITFSGQSQTYRLTAAATQASANSDVTVNIEPGLQVALVGSETVTVKGTHALNLLLHRDCFAFASRPFAAADPMGLGKFLSAVDPVSGLALRLEVTREHKRTRYSYDILYGVACPRPELGCRLAG